MKNLPTDRATKMLKMSNLSNLMKILIEQSADSGLTLEVFVFWLSCKVLCKMPFWE